MNKYFYKNGKISCLGNILDKKNFQYELYMQDGTCLGNLDNCNFKEQQKFYCTFYKTENTLRIILKDIKLLLDSIKLK